MSVQAEDWPQFRGQNCSGVSLSSRALPTNFSTTENVVWSATLGDGVASPIVIGGKVITTAMVEPQKFAVICLDAATGKSLWRKEMETGTLLRITPPNSHAASTPATDGKRVYIYFSTLGLMAFDLADGEQVWQLPLPKPAYLMDWGSAVSPIVYKDLVIFGQDDDLSPYLLAVNSATGEIRWKTERPEMLGGYSLPLLCETDGRTDIVLAGTGKLKGYNPETGDEVWTCNTLLRTVMTTPVVRDGVIYVSVKSYGDDKRTLKFALLDWLDTNQDKELTRGELPKEFWDKFDRSDKNHDGVLKGDEIDNAFQASTNMVGGGSTIQAIKGGGKGDVSKTHLLWNLSNKSPSDLASPLVVGNELFVVKKGGLSSAFDVSTGKTLWELKRLKNLGDYYASPVAGDGKIYVTGENGFVVVIEQGPELNVLATNDIGESCVATPAIADGRLFIRTREKLYCIGEKEDAPAK